jgi:hypothetical protein
MPSCGPNCVIIRPTVGNYPPPTLLVRQTRRRCLQCRYNPVSDYSHEFCYFCAPENTDEFIFHHIRCRRNAFVMFDPNMRAPRVGNAPSPSQAN